MKDKNWRKALEVSDAVMTMMKDLLFRLFLELVGTKDTDTVDGLGLGETSLVTLEESEDILHDNVFDIDLVLVVQVGGSELDLDDQQGTQFVGVDLQCSCRPWRGGPELSLRAPCPCTLASFGLQARQLMSDMDKGHLSSDLPAGASPATFSVMGTEVSL
jgi:hypothetical protein